jgi:hypothetical protein
MFQRLERIRAVMKQYTNEIQTAKLIELGLEKPKNERWVLDVANESTPSIQNVVKRQDYSIGELIEILPPRYNHEDLEINRDWRFERWLVFYRGDDTTAATELIDALYDMVIKLKEEGVI